MTDPRIRQLAEARQRITHENTKGSVPDWNGITKGAQTIRLQDAEAWLTAAVAAGIAPAAAAPVDESTVCGKCQQPFDSTDTRFDGRARFYLTPYCRGCVDRCHDNDSADHRCVICA